MIYKDLSFGKEIFENKILKLQFRCLQVFGYLVCKEDRFKCWHLIKAIMNFGVLFLGCIVEISFLSLHNPKMEQATLAIAILIVYSNLLIKIFFFWFYSKAYSELIVHVQNNMLYLKSQSEQSEKQLFRAFIKGTYHMNTIIAVLVCTSAVFTISHGIVFSVFHFNDINQGSLSRNTSLPIIFVMVPSWVLSDSFVIAYLMPCYMEFLGGLGLFLWTTFNTSFMRYAAFRLDLINHRLQHLTDYGERPVRTAMVNCAKEVVLVRRFIEKYALVSKIPLFTECTSNTALMCMLMYQVSQVKEYTNAAVVVPAILGLFGMLFVYYWNANEIYWKSGLISTSVYMSDWYTLPVVQQKDLLIFMKGCINSMTLTAVLLDMNTSTFVMTLKSSYSYFTLLTNLANESQT